MAGVINNTARQYNIKGQDGKGKNHVVRLHPGFNVVNDESWNAVKGLEYVKGLKAGDKIDFGTALNKRDAKDKSEVSKVKATPAPKDDSK